MRYRNIICLLVLSTALPINILSQSRDSVFQAYINRYADEALIQKEHYNIPASITLAQGLLESNAGQSILATEANNHFGIKCHSNWSGETYSSFDDGQMSCFRKYKTAEDSYEDHSLFIVGNHRYNTLFKLKSNDYAGWANGLKEFGYATDPNYAEKLINIIERYDLDQYDSKNGSTSNRIKKGSKVTSNKENRKSNFVLPLIGSRNHVSHNKTHLTKAEKEQIKETKKAELSREWAEYNQTAGISSLDYGRTASSIRQSKTKTLNAIPQHTIHIDQRGKYIIVQYGDTYESLQEELRLSKRELLNRNSLPMTHRLEIGEPLYLR